MPVPVIIGSSTAYCDGVDLTITKPAGTAQGDFMIAFLAYRIGGGLNQNMNDPAGWVNLRRDDVVINAITHISYRIAGASEPADYTWTVGNITYPGETVGCIITLRGVYGANPFNKVGFGHHTSTCPSVDSTVADTMVLRLVGQAHAEYAIYSWSEATHICSQYADRGGLFYTYDADLTVAYNTQAVAGSTGTATPVFENAAHPPYRNAYTLAMTSYWGGGVEPEPGPSPAPGGDPNTYIAAIQTPPPGFTILRSKKVPWAHRSNRLLNPGWMGSTTQVLSISSAKGKFDGDFVRSGGDAFGEFERISRRMQAPSSSSLSLSAMERTRDIILSWRGDIDIDVRTQSCGRVDNPINWDRIKRLCGCVITAMDSDRETIIDPDDNGETTIGVDFKTHHEPMIIRRLMPKVVTFYAQEIFADYTYGDVVVGAGPDCGYYVPATEGLYSMNLLAYYNEKNNVAIGNALLPASVTSISSYENVVLVTLSSGAVYWSSDYGKTFSESISMDGLAAFTSGRVVKVRNYSNILLGYNNLGVCGMCRSTDGGRTFYEVDPYRAVSSTPLAIAHLDDKVAYVLCEDATLAMSEDGGDSFMKMSSVPIGYPKDMVLMDEILIVGGYDGTGAPVIYGSDDNGCTWKSLARFSGSIFVGSFGTNPYVKLSSCSCGVVVASVTYNDNQGLQRSQIFRNVNWAAPSCWELMWEDYASYSNTNGLMVVTDIECACANDIMAVGRIQGQDPLYFGIRFYSEEVTFGEKWN